MASRKLRSAVVVFVLLLLLPAFSPARGIHAPARPALFNPSVSPILTEEGFFQSLWGCLLDLLEARGGEPTVPGSSLKDDNRGTIDPNGLVGNS